MFVSAKELILGTTVFRKIGSQNSLNVNPANAHAGQSGFIHLFNL